MLIALAAVISLVHLPIWQKTAAVWFFIYFAWTPTLAMLIRASSGEKGFRFAGTKTNKLVFFLYASGALVLFPGLFAGRGIVERPVRNPQYLLMAGFTPMIIGSKLPLDDASRE